MATILMVGGGLMLGLAWFLKAHFEDTAHLHSHMSANVWIIGIGICISTVVGGIVMASGFLVLIGTGSWGWPFV